MPNSFNYPKYIVEFDIRQLGEGEVRGGGGGRF